MQLTGTSILGLGLALFATRATAHFATIEWYDGADCTGKLIGTSEDAAAGMCIWLTGGGSVRSIKYADVPNELHLFQSGGDHDACTNGFQGSEQGSGCSTAPTGVNWESVALT
ncbi:Membrane metallo-endopeptidase-like 1 [Mycena kentingensis (nom. inval.)]|nr:Membrane metallo-endopeptidase-like 1 [Mycena kentingensis (nom. inval.)]